MDRLNNVESAIFVSLMCSLLPVGLYSELISSISVRLTKLVTRRQPTRLTTTNAVEINRWKRVQIPGEQLATDQTDPWQVVSRQVFTTDFTRVCGSLSRWLSLGNRCVTYRTKPCYIKISSERKTLFLGEKIRSSRSRLLQIDR